MREINISAEHLVESLLSLPVELNLCLLDSCGVSHLNSHLLIAGILPVEQVEITNQDAEKTLKILDQKLARKDLSAIFTISYNFGLKLNRIKSRHSQLDEPDVFLALFDTLIIHDYNSKKTYLTGNEQKFDKIESLLLSATPCNFPQLSGTSKITSNFTRQNYLEAVERIQEFIRDGDTYQTNLTQQIRAELPENLTPEQIFQTLRKSHPAPFASFIRRKNEVVISASPERFFRVESRVSGVESRVISTSPIKGTRPRGKTAEEDLELKNELLNSEKDRAENVMIVDLLRNDLGRICEYGSVKVEKLFDLEEHPTLFHLVSTVSGKLRREINFSDILRAGFPCGSITGAPKIRTMQIIDEIETVARGLSMGAVGIADCRLRIADFETDTPYFLDLSVAIRTMTIRGREVIFNVGGGIVIDSVPETEYEETLIKAEALLRAINATSDDLKH
jgi:para-aminobenzoate synthetase component 1